jgi:acetyl esterase/lipase
MQRTPAARDKGTARPGVGRVRGACSFGSPDDRNGHVALDLNLKARIPPTLIVQSEDDKNFITGSKLYHAALDEAKVSHEFLLYPTGGHGYGLRGTRDARAWPQAALEWLHRVGVR